MADTTHDSAFSGSVFSERKSIAVIGSGISGLSAAWLLGRAHEVTLYEADARLGGHAHTVDVSMPEGRVAVDTGFIVYNERNYPNLTALFDTLNVPTVESDMSFAASLGDGAFEYAGHSLSGLLGQKTNAVRLRFWQMVSDIFKFYRHAPSYLREVPCHDVTLGEYLDAQGYSQSFIDNHILPMGAAIWSTTASEMRSYPLVAFVRFFESHGLLTITDQPIWRTVKGGSREYIKRMMADFNGTVLTHAPVRSVRRTPKGVEVRVSPDRAQVYDDVIIATHADQALAMLADATHDETRLLGAFGYTKNRAVLHSDPALMPRRRKVWASWNYLGGAGEASGQKLCVSYWMNRLQPLETRSDLFVTLNPIREPRSGLTYAEFDYAHPLFDQAALVAQTQLSRLQGQGGVWYCGAHFGSGFHEDGLQSGLAVAEMAGQVRRPWRVNNESGRIWLPKALVAAE
ncbi:NAD(P)/FAD-dependent oxidoreductase [Asticcacaulis tiandongensis]|uniref:NAD(P)/FAD-dependent oxidoreductase n=1 Tax=Asticcacaulis tiandongensis TaxID=2565365 RepID=UPI0011299EA7|nr:FAD-dependent oxidoreductase [Asticcacaulis tiandongensis]